MVFHVEEKGCKLMVVVGEIDPHSQSQAGMTHNRTPDINKPQLDLRHSLRIWAQKLKDSGQHIRLGDFILRHRIRTHVALYP